MRPIQHWSNNRVLAAPAGVPIEECTALAVTDMILGGHQQVVSFWMPDAEELRQLNEGYPVAVIVQGLTHPPIAIGLGLRDKPHD